MQWVPQHPTEIVSKSLPIIDERRQFLVCLPIDMDMKTGLAEGNFDTTEIILSALQQEILMGTVLESLVWPKKIMYLPLKFDENLVEYVPLPPVNLRDLEPRIIYHTQTRQPAGLVLRLSNIPTCANRVIFHELQGKQPSVRALLKSEYGELTGLVQGKVLKSRFAPSASGPAMQGSSFLYSAEVGIPEPLARRMLRNLADSLPDKEKIFLNKRLEEKGPGILTGYPMIYLRDPAVVRGAIRPMTAIVVGIGGNAIYTRPEDQGLAGGDYDGDRGNVLDDSDQSGMNMYRYCMSTEPLKRKKFELFNVGSIVNTKKGEPRRMDLLHVTYKPEDDRTILHETRSKSLIGQAWYVLFQYAYLFSHHFPSIDGSGNLDNSDDNAYRCILERCRMVEQYLKKHPDCLLSGVYLDFRNAWPDFNIHDRGFWHSWNQVTYCAVSETMFPLYESIFDMRKGDTDLKFDPVMVLAGLLTSVSVIEWTKLEEGGVPTVFFRHVYSSLCAGDSGQPTLMATLAQHSVFYNLVTARNGLSEAADYMSMQATVALYRKCKEADLHQNFAQWMSRQIETGGLA
jgi:hypothetical protein